MFCRNCGNELMDGAIVCGRCGFAPGNGTSFCPHCGRPVMEGQAICLNCGFSLEPPKSDKSKLAQDCSGSSWAGTAYTISILATRSGQSFSCC